MHLEKIGKTNRVCKPTMEGQSVRYVENLATYNKIASTDSSEGKAIVNHKLT